MAFFLPLTRELVESLSADVIDFLCALYWYRCLTDELAYQFFCSDIRTKDFFLSNLQHLESENILQRISFFRNGKNESVLFLTDRGIELIKTVQPGMRAIVEKKAHSLMLLPSKIPHQLTLNAFALQIERESHNFGLFFEYTDRLYLEKISRYIYPDALIMLEGQPIFVEADRGTEGYNALLQKMQGYYRFVSSSNRDFYFNTIKLAFVLDDVKTGDRRRQTIIKAFLNSGCCWRQSQLDVWIGTKDELCYALCHGCIGTPEEKDDLDDAIKALERRAHSGYQLEHSFPLYPDPDPDDFVDPDLPGCFKKPLYVDAKFSFPVLSEPGKDDCYTTYIDYFSKLHPSILSPILSNYFSSRNASDYIVIFPTERDARNTLNTIREHTSPPMPKFCCTTVERLRSKRSFPEALFTVDAQDRLYHFVDGQLTKLEYERRITKNG